MDKIIGMVIFSFVVLFFVCGLLAQIGEYIIFIAPIIIIPMIIFSYSHLKHSHIKYIEKRFKATLLNPDKNGLYPVPTATHLAPFVEPSYQVAMAYHDSNIARVPETFTYAPRLTGTATKEDSVSPTEVIPALPSIPSLPLLDGKILLGYTQENTPKYVETKDLISTLVGGASGTGKSTLMRFILSQYLKQDSKIALIDPHMQAGEESLAKSFNDTHLFIPTAYELDQITATLSQFNLEIEQRLTGKEDRTPLILVIDEFAGLLSSQVAAEVIKTVTKISSESRKVKIYCYCISQQFHRDLIPSVLRNSFTNFLSTKSRYDVAHLLSGSKIFAAEVDKIQGYQCVHLSLMGDLDRLHFPNVMGSNVNDIIGVRHGNSSSVRSSSKTGTTLNSRDSYVIAMLKLGKSSGEIVREVYGVEGKGRPYQESILDIRRVISENIA